MQRKQQVTLQEIGRAAGVSAPTVSRVLNRHPGVSGEVRSRVMEAIEALGYDAEPILRKAAACLPKARLMKYLMTGLYLSCTVWI